MLLPLCGLLRFVFRLQRRNIKKKNQKSLACHHGLSHIFQCLRHLLSDWPSISKHHRKDLACCDGFFQVSFKASFIMIKLKHLITEIPFKPLVI